MQTTMQATFRCYFVGRSADGPIAARQTDRVAAGGGFE
jgi:hypothetical protein